MIEACSKKRMVIAIAFLIGLTVFVLIVENELAPNYTRPHTHTTAHPNMTQKDLCWMREEIDILEDCQPCTDFEKRSSSPPICVSASYRQKVKCKDMNLVVYKKCDRVMWLEERYFWTFEAVAGCVGAVAGLVTVARQKILDHLILQRIQRQVAAGV